MKKQLLSLAILALAINANAQIDFASTKLEVAGNYTKFGGDFGKSTTGIKIGAAVPISEKQSAGLSFTLNFPINEASTVRLSGGGSLPSEIKYNFKTIGANLTRYFGEEKWEGFTPYGNVNVALVLVGYTESVRGTIPAGQTVTDLTPKGSLSGFTFGAGLGGQYSFGKPKVFLEANAAIPANKANNTYISNPIPFHYNVNIGFRFSLGESASNN